MSKVNNSQFLDMILAFGKYKDFKKARDSYNACHYPKITPHRIKMAIKYILEHGQFQPPLTTRKDQGQINKLAQDKAKPVPLKLSSRISDSKRKGKTITGVTKSSSQQVSLQEKSPHTDLESLRDEENRLEEEIHRRLGDYMLNRTIIVMLTFCVTDTQTANRIEHPGKRSRKNLLHLRGERT